MQIIFIIYMCLNLLEYSSCLQGDNLCEDMVNGSLTMICCSDYEEYGDICIACKIGFTSEHGAKCRQCSLGSYGLRCGDICECLKSERCDNIVGCTNQMASNSEEGSSSSGVIYYVIPVFSVLICLGVGCIVIKYRKYCNRNRGFDLPVLPENRRESYAEIDETAMIEDSKEDITTKDSYLEPVTREIQSTKGYANETIKTKYENSNDTANAPDLPEVITTFNSYLEPITSDKQATKSYDNEGIKMKYENTNDATTTLSIPDITANESDLDQTTSDEQSDKRFSFETLRMKYENTNNALNAFDLPRDKRTNVSHRKPVTGEKHSTKRYVHEAIQMLYKNTINEETSPDLPGNDTQSKKVHDTSSLLTN